MEYVRGGAIEEVFVLRLDRGEDIHERIVQLVRDEDISSGVILSGVGTVDKVRMHTIVTTEHPSQNAFIEMSGPIEIMHIDGIIADYEPHLHFTFYVHDKDGTYGGHLEPGCRVMYLMELTIAKLRGVELTRVAHPTMGTRQLKAKRGR